MSNESWSKRPVKPLDQVNIASQLVNGSNPQQKGKTMAKGKIKPIKDAKPVKSSTGAKPMPTSKKVGGKPASAPAPKASATGKRNPRQGGL